MLQLFDALAAAEVGKSNSGKMMGPTVKDPLTWGLPFVFLKQTRKTRWVMVATQTFLFSKIPVHHSQDQNPEGIARWWFQIFLEFSSLFGEMIHFDDHIFQMG